MSYKEMSLEQQEEFKADIYAALERAEAAGYTEKFGSRLLDEDFRAIWKKWSACERQSGPGWGLSFVAKSEIKKVAMALKAVRTRRNTAHEVRAARAVEEEAAKQSRASFARWCKVGGEWAILAEGWHEGDVVSVRTKAGAVSEKQLGQRVAENCYLPVDLPLEAPSQAKIPPVTLDECIELQRRAASAYGEN